MCEGKNLELCLYYHFFFSKEKIIYWNKGLSSNLPLMN